MRPKFLTPVHLRTRPHPKAHKKLEGLDAVAAVGLLLIYSATLLSILGVTFYIFWKMAGG